jgi:mannosyltransferase OCH1-like enzyme
MIRFTEKFSGKNQKYNIEIHDPNIFKPPIRSTNNVIISQPNKNIQPKMFPLINLNVNLVENQKHQKQQQKTDFVNVSQNTMFKMNIKSEEKSPEEKSPEEKCNIPYPMNATYNSIIPLKIYQTWFSKELPPNIGNCVKDIKEKNPEFEHFLFDDEDCRQFILTNFGCEVSEVFDTLIPGAYKADLWRYCVLYINGGIYLDIKYKCINGFRLIALTEQEWFVKDMDDSGCGVYNALMITKPNNPMYLQFINKVVQNVKNRFYGDNSLMPTGPHMLKHFFSDKIIREFSLAHQEFDNYYITDKRFNINILKIDDNYRVEQKNNTNNKRHYSTMWVNREIYL